MALQPYCLAVCQDDVNFVLLSPQQTRPCATSESSLVQLSHPELLDNGHIGSLVITHDDSGRTHFSGRAE